VNTIEVDFKLEQWPVPLATIWLYPFNQERMFSSSWIQLSTTKSTALLLVVCLISAIHPWGSLDLYVGFCYITEAVIWDLGAPRATRLWQKGAHSFYHPRLARGYGWDAVSQKSCSCTYLQMYDTKIQVSSVPLHICLYYPGVAAWSKFGCLAIWMTSCARLHPSHRSLLSLHTFFWSIATPTHAGTVFVFVSLVHHHASGLLNTTWPAFFHNWTFNHINTWSESKCFPNNNPNIYNQCRTRSQGSFQLMCCDKTRQTIDVSIHSGLDVDIIVWWQVLREK